MYCKSKRSLLFSKEDNKNKDQTEIFLTWWSPKPSHVVNHSTTLWLLHVPILTSTESITLHPMLEKRPILSHQKNSKFTLNLHVTKPYISIIQKKKKEFQSFNSRKWAILIKRTNLIAQRDDNIRITARGIANREINPSFHMNPKDP